MEINAWVVVQSLLYALILIALLYTYLYRPPQNYYTRGAIVELMVAIGLAIVL
jgi:hypothetical protein